MIGHRAGRKSVVRGAATLLAAAALACGGDPVSRLAEARGHLADADYAEARAAAEAGLAGDPDPRTAWGLELVLLEAQARAGRGEQATALLGALAERHPERVPPSQYAATASQLRSAGDGAAAIQALDLGLRLHPGDALIERLIGDAQSGDVDPAELEMLRTLGYVE